MAWNWYLNMEPLSLEIAREHAEKMTDSNFLDGHLDAEGTERIPDDDSFLNNLKLGFIAITMASCFFESSLNTFLREKHGYDPEGKVIHGNEDLKLEILFHDNTSDLNSIKRSHCWRNWQRLKRVRNELIHYKNNSPEFMASWPLIDEWKIGNEPIGYFFTKSTIIELLDNVEDVINQIAAAVELTVSPFPIVFGADGRCGIGSYYCSKEEAALALENEGVECAGRR